MHPCRERPLRLSGSATSVAQTRRRAHRGGGSPREPRHAVPTGRWPCTSPGRRRAARGGAPPPRPRPPNALVQLRAICPAMHRQVPRPLTTDAHDPEPPQLRDLLRPRPEPALRSHVGWRASRLHQLLHPLATASTCRTCRAGPRAQHHRRLRRPPHPGQSHWGVAAVRAGVDPRGRLRRAARAPHLRDHGGTHPPRLHPTARRSEIAADSAPRLHVEAHGTHRAVQILAFRWPRAAPRSSSTASADALDFSWSGVDGSRRRRRLRATSQGATSVVMAWSSPVWVTSAGSRPGIVTSARRMASTPRGGAGTSPSPDTPAGRPDPGSSPCERGDSRRSQPVRSRTSGPVRYRPAPKLGGHGRSGPSRKPCTSWQQDSGRPTSPVVPFRSAPQPPAPPWTDPEPTLDSLCEAALRSFA